MHLILIRHGLPVRVELSAEAVDPPLSDRGRRDVQLLANWLDLEDIDAIYSSPLRRARETAAHIAGGCGMDVNIVAALSEFAVGVQAYIPFEDGDAAAHPQWQRWKQHLDNDTVDSALRQFRTRVRATIDRIATRHAAKTVAIACHGGVINAYLTSVLGIEQVVAFSAWLHLGLAGLREPVRGGDGEHRQRKWSPTRRNRRYSRPTDAEH
jgi:probable phosphoglycerate mutase